MGQHGMGSPADGQLLSGNGQLGRLKISNLGEVDHEIPVDFLKTLVIQLVKAFAEPPVYQDRC